MVLIHVFNLILKVYRCFYCFIDLNLECTYFLSTMFLRCYLGSIAVIISKLVINNLVVLILEYCAAEDEENGEAKEEQKHILFFIISSVHGDCLLPEF